MSEQEKSVHQQLAEAQMLNQNLHSIIQEMKVKDDEGMTRRATLACERDQFKRGYEQSQAMIQQLQEHIKKMAPSAEGEVVADAAPKGGRRRVVAPKDVVGESPSAP